MRDTFVFTKHHGKYGAQWCLNDGDSSDDGLIQVQKFERTSKRHVWREARHRKDSVRTYLSRRAIKLLTAI
jgi:hypothetical protein